MGWTMLIDNKVDYKALSGKTAHSLKTVAEFILKYSGLDKGRKGSLDVVTGFFSIGGLSLLAKELDPENKYRLVLSELTSRDDFMSRVIDLLRGDGSFATTLGLSQAAKNAIEFLKRETVQVRAITSAFCHAKAYLYTDDEDDTHDYYVMGSSNMTEAGLGVHESGNVELNFAQTGSTNEDYQQLRKWFDLQWEKVAQTKIVEDPRNPAAKKVDVKTHFIKCIEDCFAHPYTPEDIYYKILFELFGGDLGIDGDLETQKEMSLLQDSEIYRTLFDYQKKGVVSLVKMLRRWNGAILADAVGLGKTFSALAVIKYFQNNGYKTLLLCPKKLGQNWNQYRSGQGSRFEQDGFDYTVRFHTDLQDDRMNQGNGAKMSVLRKSPKLLVVVDESHNLRNHDSGRYKMLLDDLLRQKPDDKVREVKVLLLSATPINTNLTDVRNQFRLIARGNDATFNVPDFDIASLNDVFRDANKHFNAWCKEPNHTIAGFIKGLSPQFMSLADKLIMARTRQMVEKTLGGGLGFPKREKPQNEYVDIENIGDFKSVSAIYEMMEQEFNLTAYQPTQYMEPLSVEKTAAKDWQNNTYRERYLVGMMSVLFMKRLESSWYSCLTTVTKVKAAHEHALKLVYKFLASKGEIDSYEIDLPMDEDAFDEDESGNDFTLHDKTIDLAQMARIDDFRKGLEGDVQALGKFCANFEAFKKKFEAGKAKDDKLERLLAILAEKQKKPNRKAIVFTTFGDTALYLYEQARKRHPEWRIACVTGQEVKVSADATPGVKNDFQGVLCRFAPRAKLYRERDWTDLYEKAGLAATCFDAKTQKWTVTYDQWRAAVAKQAPSCQKLLDAEIDVLIATDCLSEGQNLQDADLVVNYDIHWNPVRLIQRFGRIDRIGSVNAKVKSVNFWPTKNYDDYLKLADRINHRMALMRVTGTETQETDEAFEKTVADDPIIDRNTKKFLEQLAKNDISEIEGSGGAEGSGSGLGLGDFSLETFRQDLLEYLEKNRDFFRRMPSGVFSGFCLTKPDLADKDIHESLVAVLGSPRRAPGDTTTPYKRVHLVLQPAGAKSVVWQDLPAGSILAFLRRHKKDVRNLPEWIEKGDAEMIGKLSALLKAWLASKKPDAQTKELVSVFSGKKAIEKSGGKIEDGFDPENLDLIAWEYVSDTL